MLPPAPPSELCCCTAAALANNGERAQRGSRSTDTSGLPSLMRFIVEPKLPSLTPLPGVVLVLAASRPLLCGVHTPLLLEAS
jgi:hypothetical protein